LSSTSAVSHHAAKFNLRHLSTHNGIISVHGIGSHGRHVPWHTLAALHPASVHAWWMVKENGGVKVSAAGGTRSLLEGRWCSPVTGICCYLSLFLFNMSQAQCNHLTVRIIRSG
jgi:hypothetical protein